MSRQREDGQRLPTPKLNNMLRQLETSRGKCPSRAHGGKVAELNRQRAHARKDVDTVTAKREGQDLKERDKARMRNSKFLGSMNRMGGGTAATS
jgi:hypothetical protein